MVPISQMSKLGLRWLGLAPGLPSSEVFSFGASVDFGQEASLLSWHVGSRMPGAAGRKGREEASCWVCVVFRHREPSHPTLSL